MHEIGRQVPWRQQKLKVRTKLRLEHEKLKNERKKEEEEEEEEEKEKVVDEAVKVEEAEQKPIRSIPPPLSIS
jgi:hypothetical protein